MKRRLYIDGNTVYGIDEECMKERRSKKESEKENYLLVLMCVSLRGGMEAERGIVG